MSDHLVLDELQALLGVPLERAPEVEPSAADQRLEGGVGEAGDVIEWEPGQAANVRRLDVDVRAVSGHSSCARVFSWVSLTPFGSPVVPEV